MYKYHNIPDTVDEIHSLSLLWHTISAYPINSYICPHMLPPTTDVTNQEH